MNDKYNILICFAKLGAGRIETACLTQIKEYARRGYNVFVLAEEGLYADTLKKMKNVNFINFKYESKNSFNLDKVKQVEDILIKNDIKLVYIHQIDCISSVCSACLLNKIPYIAYVHHGILGVYDLELKMGNMSNEFLKLYYKYAYRIITIIEESKQENIERFNIKEDKYEVIPNCIDFEKFKSNTEPNLDNVLLISRLEIDKGNGILHGLKFFKEYKKVNPNAKLTICGSGGQEDVVKKQIKELGIECTMLGARNDVKEIMEQNGIVLGVGRCIQEAIAMKRYAIITGNESFQGIVTPTNIDMFANVNFSGNTNKNINYKEMVDKLLEYSKDGKILEGTYNWLITNRNIKQNLYEIENIQDISNPLDKLDKNEVIRILLGELQYMHTWMQKEIDRGWDARQQTEDYYLSREEWNEGQIKNKESEIEKLREENTEINEKLDKILKSNSWKLLKKVRDKKLIKKISHFMKGKNSN